MWIAAISEEEYEVKICHPERGFIRVEGSSHLVSAKQKITAKILRFAALTQDDRMLGFRKNDHPIGTEKEQIFGGIPYAER